LAPTSIRAPAQEPDTDQDIYGHLPYQTERLRYLKLPPLRCLPTHTGGNSPEVTYFLGFRFRKGCGFGETAFALSAFLFELRPAGGSGAELRLRALPERQRPGGLPNSDFLPEGGRLP
jgi:hypothetical protein